MESGEEMFERNTSEKITGKWKACKWKQLIKLNWKNATNVNLFDHREKKPAIRKGTSENANPKEGHIWKTYPKKDNSE